MTFAIPARPCESPVGDHPLLIIPFFRRWPRSIARDLIYTFIWNTVFALAFSVIGMAFDRRAEFAPMFWSNMVFAQLIGYLIHVAFAVGHRAFPRIDRQSTSMRAVYYAGVPLLSVVVGMWIASGLLGGDTMRYWIMTPRNITVMSGISALLSCILLLVYIPRERAARAEASVAREMARVAAAERATTVAQMQLLEAQVEPHFLYNTLAHVDSMIDSEPRTAHSMLEHLVVLLRATAAAADGTSTLGRQATWTRAYLELLQMRMGARLAWTMDIDPSLADTPVPPALLQPLVENAVKHGLEPQVAGGTVTISAQRREGALQVAVADTGAGFRATRDASGSTGIGLANLRTRLAMIYGDRATMTVTDNVPQGARVTLQLPLA